MGELRLAVDHYRRALQYAPDDIYSLKNLAWILATTEDKAIRSPTEAVAMASRACQLTRYQQVEPLDTLAIACAAAGMLDKAVEAAEEALQLAVLTGQSELADRIRGRLQDYRANQPPP
jgi:tetratricopeptide (TPR) repeat protein